MNFAQNISDAERLAFVTNCELASCSHSLAEHVAAMKAPRVLTASDPLADAQAAVVEGNLLSFAKGVSRQSKEDVMNSFLFATLAAKKKYNPETEGQQWYGHFNAALKSVGWLSTNWSYARYRSTQQRLSMDQVGLEILGSAIAAAALPGPASAAMLKVAADAVKALMTKEEPLRLFERQTKMHRGGNFRIGACDESADGTVTVALGAVNFLADSAVTNVLFWEWNSTEISTYRGEDCMVLNTSLYAKVRKKIEDRLVKEAESAIDEFDI